MSKKSKRQKMKKKLKKMLQQQIQAKEAEFQTEDKTAISKEIETNLEEKPKAQKQIQSVKESRLALSVSPYVKADLLRISVILASIFVIIAFLKIISLRTDLLANFANLLASILHIK